MEDPSNVPTSLREISGHGINAVGLYWCEFCEHLSVFFTDSDNIMTHSIHDSLLSCNKVVFSHFTFSRRSVFRSIQIELYHYGEPFLKL